MKLREDIADGQNISNEVIRHIISELTGKSKTIIAAFKDQFENDFKKALKQLEK